MGLENPGFDGRLILGFMKYAILSDIHANLEALDVVLRDQKAQGCTHMACLGDIVGYGADPKECVDHLRPWL